LAEQAEADDRGGKCEGSGDQRCSRAEGAALLGMRVDTTGL
jgi:hypothetical protein